MKLLLHSSLFGIAALVCVAAVATPVRPQAGEEVARPVLREPAESALAAPSPDTSSRDPSDPGNSSRLIPTAESIARFQARVAKRPDDYRSRVILAKLYTRHGRETGDHRSHLRAESHLRKVLTARPNDAGAAGTLATVLIAQHRFREADELASELIDRHPGSEVALAAQGDAALELGRTAQARQCYEQLAVRNPSPAVLVRLAAAVERGGDVARARSLMQQAHAEAYEADLTDKQLAWYELRLGVFWFNHGNLDRAENHLREALALREDYAPAMVRLGYVEASRGRTDVASVLFEAAVRESADASAMIALSELNRHLNQREAAEDWLTRAETSLLMEQERVDGLHCRALSLLYSDAESNTERAVELAKQDLAARPDVFAWDTLAWAQYRHGQPNQALESITQALAKQTPSASIHFHAGLIYRASGDPDAAVFHLQRALQINPWFSLKFSAEARQQLSELRQLTSVQTR